MTNPTDDTVSDLIGFYFEADAPKEAVKLGSSLQQWVQFRKPGDKEYMTVQCYSKVGDPFVSEVKTFKGREVMDDSSPQIAGKKLSAQNTAEKAKKKESYGLDRDSGQYGVFDSNTAGNHVIPCLAVYDLGRSIVADDAFLGDYEFKFGARFFDNDASTEFKTTGSKDKTGSFVLPEADLGKLYEETVVEDKAAITEIVNEKSFGNVQETFINNKGTKSDKPEDKDTPLDIHAEMRYFQKVTGGYKVYDSSAGAEDRWYFNFKIEVPKNLLKAGEIVYQWISWDETTQGIAEPNVGAVACKTEVGNPISTEAVQWFTKQNMACSGDEVQNKKWFMQLSEGKLKTAYYQAFWWNTVNYQLADSDRVVVLTDGTEVAYET